MPNRLASESSPYLLQHKNNPVDWYPWNEEALEIARKEDKPIFLSIGYAACHWCHVMEHESFEDPETARIMNKLFVNIKVDREERPDLDAIYMQAVVALTRHGGWPMSVFLTPAGEPFYGGTYFPPENRYNMPAFKQVLLSVADAWKQDKEGVTNQAGRLTEYLQQTLSGLSHNENLKSKDVLEQASRRIARQYDWQNGGWGKAPKFPQPMTISFLLRLATRGDNSALKIASHALESMAKGGMYDVVGGGFARYSVDDEWLVPHFEKMLYDNAQLSLVYLQAFLLTGNSSFRRVAEETLEFISREMTSEEGGFYSSLDADSEGEEGTFYVWSPAEVKTALLDVDEFRFVTAAYNITEEGNFEGKTVLQRAMDDSALSKMFDIELNLVEQRLKEAHQRLLAYRSNRIRPGTDDKCVVAWNGLMLLAFSEAAKYFGKEKYLEMAMRNARFILAMTRDPKSGRLSRTWRAGQRGPQAFLEDYAALGLGLLALYEATGDSSWFSEAKALTDDMLNLFHDKNAGFYDTGKDHEKLIVRPKDSQDNATPSGESLACNLLLKLAALTGDSNYKTIAEDALSPILKSAAEYPTAFANWLCAADFMTGPVIEVALIHPGNKNKLSEFKQALWSTFRPRLVLATGKAGETSPELLEFRNTIDDKPTAYVCENFTCQQPTTEVTQMLELIK